jgi:hypothetical protein
MVDALLDAAGPLAILVLGVALMYFSDRINEVISVIRKLGRPPCETCPLLLRLNSMTKKVSVEYSTDEYDKPITLATCPDCGATTWSYGQGEGSAKRCMVLMRDECQCPENESGCFFMYDDEVAQDVQSPF